MKKLKLNQKLTAVFLLLAVMAAVIGVIGWLIAYMLNNNEENLYIYTVNGNYANKIISNIHEQQVCFNEALLNISKMDKRRESVDAINALSNELEGFFQDLEGRLVTEKGKADVARMRLYYNTNLKPAYETMLQYIEQGDVGKATDAIEELGEPIAEMSRMADDFLAYAEYLMFTQKTRDTQSFRVLSIVLIILTATVFVIAVLMGRYLSRLIARPIVKMARAAEKLSVGDIDVDVAIHTHDEVGDLSQSFQKMVRSIQEQAAVLKELSDGNYAVSVPIRSDQDIMNKAINILVEKSNQILFEILNASEQVSAGAEQISAGAQNLASGTGQQSGSIEHFSSSLKQLQKRTAIYSESSRASSEENNRAYGLLQDSIRSMEELLSAMQGIEESSRQINNVINVIEDIAFQTNILALNAAVEAARVGQYGRGFAVVADEVRNLAGKSAEAARESTALIKGSNERVQVGSQIAKTTSEYLEQVAGHALTAVDKTDALQLAAVEQEQYIRQINTEISHISEVVNANSSTAQQSAAAAEQMAAQSAALRNLLQGLKLSDPVEKPFAPPPKPSPDYTEEGFTYTQPGGEPERSIQLEGHYDKY